MRRDESRRGSTLIEFTLVFLVLLAISVGAMEGARAVWTYMTLAHAARDASRYAMVRGGATPISTEELRAYLLARAPGIDSESLEALLLWEPDSSAGSAVEVQLSYSFAFTASPLFLSESGLTLSTSSRALIAK